MTIHDAVAMRNHAYVSLFHLLAFAMLNHFLLDLDFDF